jgi:glycerate kinase
VSGQARPDDQCPWRVLVASDSWKGSLTAAEVGHRVAAGLASGGVGRVEILPLADGGEGTMAVVHGARGGVYHRVHVHDAYGRGREGRLLVLDDGTAVVEAAEGPGFVPPALRPRPAQEAGSEGLAELLLAAREIGARHAVVTLGGTGSSDGGLGLLRGLGARIDPPMATGLQGLRQARIEHLPPLPLPVEVWCDVDSPLTGPRGAVWRFGPQKGLEAADLPAWDQVMAAWGAMLERVAGRRVCELPGAGAAGGLGAALAALGAPLKPGGPAVAALVGLPAAVLRADWVVTGEGQVDVQSLSGKVVGTVVAEARRWQRPVVVLAPSWGPGYEAVEEAGARLWPVLTEPLAMDAAIRQAADLAEAAGARLGRWLYDEWRRSTTDRLGEGDTSHDF